MKNKASLTLIELTVMVTVFALASALCLRLFVWSYRADQRDEALSRALTQAQNAAELTKAHRGDLTAVAEALGGTAEKARWSMGFDESFRETEQDPDYTLCVERMESETPYLGCAKVTVAAPGETLYSLNVNWQEEAENDG